MVEVGSLVVAALAAVWAVYGHFQRQREQRRHDETIEDLRNRSAATTELSGILREVQHCTDEHGGEAGYQERIDSKIDEARGLVLRNVRLFGEDVVAAVQQETKIAREVFRRQSDGHAHEDDIRELHAARAERVATLHRLGRHPDFPPPRGSLLTRS